tara:strand:+ start:199 stop:399 length:201 start_codon:yes stop_codon:yes gene_type:complete
MSDQTPNYNEVSMNAVAMEVVERMSRADVLDELAFYLVETYKDNFGHFIDDYELVKDDADVQLAVF